MLPLRIRNGRGCPRTKRWVWGWAMMGMGVLSCRAESHALLPLLLSRAGYRRFISSPPLPSLSPLGPATDEAMKPPRSSLQFLCIRYRPVPHTQRCSLPHPPPVIATYSPTEPLSIYTRLAPAPLFLPCTDTQRFILSRSCPRLFQDAAPPFTAQVLPSKAQNQPSKSPKGGTASQPHGQRLRGRRHNSGEQPSPSLLVPATFRGICIPPRGHPLILLQGSPQSALEVLIKSPLSIHFPRSSLPPAPHFAVLDSLVNSPSTRFKI